MAIWLVKRRDIYEQKQPSVVGCFFNNPSCQINLVLRRLAAGHAQQSGPVAVLKKRWQHTSQRRLLIEETYTANAMSFVASIRQSFDDVCLIKNACVITDRFTSMEFRGKQAGVLPAADRRRQESGEESMMSSVGKVRWCVSSLPATLAKEFCQSSVCPASNAVFATSKRSVSKVTNRILCVPTISFMLCAFMLDIVIAARKIRYDFTWLIFANQPKESTDVISTW